MSRVFVRVAWARIDSAGSPCSKSCPPTTSPDREAERARRNFSSIRVSVESAATWRSRTSAGNSLASSVACRSAASDEGEKSVATRIRPKLSLSGWTAGWPPAAARMVNTGQWALRRTASATLPSLRRSSPDRPCVPITMRPARISSQSAGWHLPVPRRAVCIWPAPDCRSRNESRGPIRAWPWS